MRQFENEKREIFCPDEGTIRSVVASPSCTKGSLGSGGFYVKAVKKRHGHAENVQGSDTTMMNNDQMLVKY